MAWERLDQIYGLPEAVEQALFNKLENFPKVTTKDLQRLRDLATCCQSYKPPRKTATLQAYRTWIPPEELGDY